MAADGVQDRLVIVLVHRQTAGIAAELAGGRLVRFGHLNHFALDGDHLPAAAQPDFLRRDGHPCQPSVRQPAVGLFPLALRGENPAG